jgi:p21-activated kinase 1
MANSTGASSSTGYPKSSRFSTLKMFKLNGKDKPPPPPPKDPYYLQNKSMTSLSPDSLSIPPQSPISPHYFSQFPHRQSPVPSQSTMSLASSAASQLSVTPTDQTAPKKKKSINFLKLGKRSKSSSREAEVPPPPLPRDGVEDQGDHGVTWPSNFQVRTFS